MVGGAMFVLAICVAAYMMLATGQAVPGSDMFFAANAVREPGTPPQISLLSIPVMLFAVIGTVLGAALLLPRVAEVGRKA